MGRTAFSTPDYRCLTCGYPLNSLSSNRCPECGCEFNPEDPSTYVYCVLDGRRLAMLALKSWFALFFPIAFNLMLVAVGDLGLSKFPIVDDGLFGLALMVWVAGPMYGWNEARVTMEEIYEARRGGATRLKHPAVARFAIVFLWLLSAIPLIIVVGSLVVIAGRVAFRMMFR